MQWYYSKNGTQLGPISTEDIKAKLGSGEISATDLVWKEGMADWVPSSQVGELRTSVATPEVIPAAPGAVSPLPAQPSPYAPSSAPGPTATPSAIPGQPVSQGMAIGSMVCGILALLTCCLWCLSGPLAIVAVVLGHLAIGKANAEPAQFGGKGMAKAGLITGYLAILATLLFTICSVWAQTQPPENLKFLPQEMRERLEEQRKLREGLRNPAR
ncbi:MAG: GYF domain-containing protein [Luteolibacter sp.]